MVYTNGKYLIADSIKELHAFAQKIGLKRSWFQSTHIIPHYKVWGATLKKALKFGAKKIATKNLISNYLFKN